DWYRRSSNVYWIASALFNPIETGLRYVAAKYGLSDTLQKLQDNLVLWFYTAFVHRLGSYLIELNSVRLRVGARRCREALDTVGYAHTGPREDQLRNTEQAARQSDLLLLVLHARNPARQADLDMLTKLRDWFASQPELKMPPVLAVLTHIDLLSPAMEWAPP